MAAGILFAGLAVKMNVPILVTVPGVMVPVPNVMAPELLIDPNTRSKLDIVRVLLALTRSVELTVKFF